MVLFKVLKRKWIIQQYRTGRSPTSIAEIQKISRQYIYDLVEKHKQLGELAYKALKAGRPKQLINSTFIQKVVQIRKDDDYGSEKIYGEGTH